MDEYLTPQVILHLHGYVAVYNTGINATDERRAQLVGANRKWKISTLLDDIVASSRWFHSRIV